MIDRDLIKPGRQPGETYEEYCLRRNNANWLLKRYLSRGKEPTDTRAKQPTNVNVGTVGHIDHGRVRVARAIANTRHPRPVIILIE